MIKKGIFTSVWENGEVTTPATLDTETGYVDIDSVEVSDEYEVLISEYFEDEEGNKYKICPECHEYIVKDVEFEHEGELGDKVCSHPYCSYKEYGKRTIGREQAISELIDNEIASILKDSEYNDYSYVNDIFRGGFKGYDNFTDEELAAEYKEQLHMEEKITVIIEGE